jgi:hypothetical protein
MIFRIPRGKHRAHPLRFGFWWRRNSFAWLVKFDESCRYDLQSDDQFDTNKLCGIGYLPGHHKDSARFGWVYDRETGLIVINAYCYINGRRDIQSICFCIVGNQYHMSIDILNSQYCFRVYDNEGQQKGMIMVKHCQNKKFKYRLGVYFGGNQKAPHEIKIELKKLR